MARKVFTPEEQGKIDLVTSATRERKAKEKGRTQKVMAAKALEVKVPECSSGWKGEPATTAMSRATLPPCRCRCSSRSLF